MKSFLFSLCFMLLSVYSVEAQITGSHQSEPPPINPGYPFTRGLNVDCADEIVIDINNGNMNGLEQNLITFLTNNSISYVILFGLENSNVFGNVSLENSLRKLLRDLRSAIPGLKIGLCGSDAGIFKNTGFLHVWDPFGKECYPADQARMAKEIELLANDQSNSALVKRSELCKFFIRAARFGAESRTIHYQSPCEGTFDVFYLQYRYWLQTSSMQSMQNEFNNFRDILYVLKALKCLYNCTGSIDAEFLPTEMFNLQGWTAIDQITDIDPAADRLVLPVFTNNSADIFDHICRTLHLLTDIFSKVGTRVFIQLSAESPAFQYCNSTTIPNDHLGNYLNGTALSSGNMYSVEKKFLDKFNDPSYYCVASLGLSYFDNHFTSTNTHENILCGITWGPYSMMNDHSLFRKKDNRQNISECIPILYQLFDTNGRLVFQNEKNEGFKPANANLYFRKIIYSDGKIETTKVFIPGDQ